MKKALVCGGAGFLGSHLVEKLLDKNYSVIILDNLYTGRMENINEFIDLPNVEFIKEDIVNPLDKKKFHDVNEVYNLACPASPPHYQKDPIYTTRVSVWGTYNLLELCREIGAKFFQASTSEVYGDPTVHPQVEDYWGNVNSTGIRSCYDEGKRCAESLIFDYHRYHKLPVKVVRIFNTYGPKMDPLDGRVVSNFILQALKGEDITVYGEGDQTRSFCYVDDLINGFIALMDADDAIVGPFNMGNPDEYTVKELAAKVIELTDSKSKLVYEELPQDDPTRRRPDISRAKEDLSWEPSVSLNQGLINTIEYYKNYI